MQNGKIYSFKDNERTDFSDFNCHWWHSSAVSKHSHDDYYEISIVTEGDLINKVNNENLKQREGDVVVIKPSVSHSITNDSAPTSVHYNFAVRKRFFENFIQNKPYLQNTLNGCDYLYFHLDDDTFRFVKRVATYIDNTNYDSFSYTLVETALYAIFSCYMINEQSRESKPNKISEYCRDAINKINNYSYVTMQASEIYKLYPVSHTAFIAEFKKITGKTLVSFLQSKKLDYAKTLLTTTEYSVLEIASILSYDSLSYFIKIFKKEYSLTPYKYRKNNVGTISPY